MPQCSYGAACTRTDCVYSHPPRPGRRKPSVQVAKSEHACLAFLGGVCSFGALCRDRHPADSGEVARLVAEYARKPCRFGAACRTPGCLFGHPNPPAAAEAAAAAVEPNEEAATAALLNGESFDAVVAVGALTAGAASWEPFAAEPPTPMLSHEDQLIAFFESLGEMGQMAKVGAMLERFEGREDQLFESLANKYGRPVVALVGTPPPPPDPLSPPPPPPPPPAPPAPAPAPAVPAPQVWPKAPHLVERGHAPLPSAAGGGGGVHGGGGSWGGSWGLPPSSASPSSWAPRPRPPVRIPASLWVSDLSRSAGAAFAVADPLERFATVNDLGPLPLGTPAVPLLPAEHNASSEEEGGFVAGKKSTKLRRLGVLDLHFQSTRTAPVVLSALLDRELGALARLGTPPPPLAPPGGGLEGVRAACVWVVTGTGHHTGARTHVKAGALFDAAEAFLAQGGYDYARGRDGAGRCGAFAVYG